MKAYENFSFKFREPVDFIDIIRSMKEKAKESLIWVLFICGLLCLWQIASMVMDNRILCPSVMETFEQMKLLLVSEGFYKALLATMARSLYALILSFVSAMAAAALAIRFKWIKAVFDRLCPLLQVIPNAALIILVLFWMSRDNAVFTVVFLLVFPAVYRSFSMQLQDLEIRYQSIFKIYPQPFFIRLKYAILPLMKPVFISSLQNSLTLTIKSSVMAEILASVSVGIGRSIQSARMDLNVAGVIAWVILLMIMTLAASWLLKCLIRHLFSH